MRCRSMNHNRTLQGPNRSRGSESGNVQCMCGDDDHHSSCHGRGRGRGSNRVLPIRHHRYSIPNDQDESGLHKIHSRMHRHHNSIRYMFRDMVHGSSNLR